MRTPAGVVARTFRLYYEDSCGTYAAAIAYYAIFSLVPLSIVVLSVFGLVVDKERIVRFVFDQVPLKETPSVQNNVNEIVRRAQQAGFAGLTFGLITLVWSASGIFAAVRRGLNAASHRASSRAYWHGKLIDFALIPSLGLLILLALGMTAVAQILFERAGSVGGIDINTNIPLTLTSRAIPAVFSFMMFSLLYRYVPTVRPRWKEALAGASAATVLFETAKNVFAVLFALTPFSTDTAIYAGFGTALAFLLWMFINASILLLGAEFARSVALARRIAPMVQEPVEAGTEARRPDPRLRVREP
ncbi:MAG: YihY/virulence factor BrkB family protein [Chloroflexi bacterium]|nr:YihY/virulence factor BrkB family protein [Chloroflexota bacterium]